jgi:hypothetical protein
MLSARFGDGCPKATTTDVRWTILRWDNLGAANLSRSTLRLRSIDKDMNAR